MIGKLGLALLALALFSPGYVNAVPGTISVDLEGNLVDVNYDAEGVTISGSQLDYGFFSLILDTEVTGSPGILEITLDRNFIDATTNDGLDDTYIVLADGDEPNFEETDTNPQSRTLRIELPFGTEEVEIIGTSFGAPQTVIEEPKAPTEEPKTTTPEPPEEPKAPTEEPPEEPKAPTEEPTSPTEEPKTKCGPGTVLKDGVCVLEEKCGPGTILQDGVCVASPSGTSNVSVSKDFIFGGGAALVISFIVIIIFAAIARANRTKNN